MKRILLLILNIFIFACGFAQSDRVECEDTCSHIHGIDMSHYQGNVFWEAVGETKMAYVYLTLLINMELKSVLTIFIVLK